MFVTQYIQRHFEGHSRTVIVTKPVTYIPIAFDPYWLTHTCEFVKCTSARENFMQTRVVDHCYWAHICRLLAFVRDLLNITAETVSDSDWVPET